MNKYFSQYSPLVQKFCGHRYDNYRHFHPIIMIIKGQYACTSGYAMPFILFNIYFKN